MTTDCSSATAAFGAGRLSELRSLAKDVVVVGEACLQVGREDLGLRY